MDFVLPIMLALSILGNVFQFNQTQDAKAEADKWQETTRQNYEAYVTAKEANDAFIDIVESLENSLTKCNEKTNSLLDTIDGWRDADRLQMAEVENLKDRLAGLDFGVQCRVPDWVDFEANKD